MKKTLEQKAGNGQVPFILKGKMPIYFAFEMLSQKKINYLIQVYEDENMRDLKGQIKVTNEGTMYFFGFRDQENKKEEVLKYLYQKEKELLVISLDNKPLEAEGFISQDYFELNKEAYNKELLAALDS